MLARGAILRQDFGFGMANQGRAMKKLSSAYFKVCSLAACIAALTIAAPATAPAAVSVFVSSEGSDAGGCGTATNPCATIAYALINAVSAGGSILVLDDAIVSGPITITESVSIISAGSQVTIKAGVNFGLRVSAGSTGRVVLKGLTIDGRNAGTVGIDVLAAASVSVINCLVQNFLSDGIRIEPNTALKYEITNTSSLDNGAHGIYIAPRPGGSAVGSINNSDAHRNRGGYGGIAVDGSGGGAATAHIHNTRSNFNTNMGFGKVTDGSFYLSGSTATGNANNIGSFGGGGPGYSYQNNFLRGNTSDTGTGFLTNVTQQ
jgi:hypothetical protein